jgi:putative tributyrin esterase
MMSLIRQHFRSEVLELSTSLTALIPDHAPLGATGHPTLYLLHGLSDDDSMWVRQTAIERYASQRGIAVVMPQVHRSYYSDEAHGGDYWTFLTQELPTLLAQVFRLTEDPAERFVAGLSMGGYGAIKWALREPGAFAAAASLSGALGLAQRTVGGPGTLDPRLWDMIFDSQPIVGTDDDVVALLARRADEGVALPALYVCCGTEDALYPENLRFVDAATTAGIPLTTSFSPGAHDWGYWGDRIRDVVDWLPLAR